MKTGLNKSIRTGVIGAGSMGQHHARIWATMPGSQLVGVADIDESAAQKVAGRYEVTAYSDYRDLLTQIDVVSVAAPTTLHFEIGMACLDQGVHALIEKPLAASLDEARLLTQTAQQAGLVLQAGHVERFNPTFVELVNVLKGHDLIALEARRLSPFASRAADVSVVYDLMVHDLDLVLALINVPLSTIQAAGRKALSSQIDHAIALLTFADGRIAHISASKVTQSKIRQLTITCTTAFIVADFLARTVMIYHQSAAGYFAHRDEVLYRQEGVIEQVYVPPVEPLYAELQHFLNCVREGRQPEVGGEEAVRVMSLTEIIEAQILAGLKESQ
ncbi:MAG: Gfo/Idh/MocA family oxidoreductase [Chloroflexi bacterium]|nr:Gfo/Idh/MocA family oxidoreductase [Chloroflexota bacterium]